MNEVPGKVHTPEGSILGEFCEIEDSIPDELSVIKYSFLKLSACEKGCTCEFSPYKDAAAELCGPEIGRTELRSQEAGAHFEMGAIELRVSRELSIREDRVSVKIDVVKLGATIELNVTEVGFLREMSATELSIIGKASTFESHTSNQGSVAFSP